MTLKHNIELLPLRRRPFHLIYLTIKVKFTLVLKQLVVEVTPGGARPSLCRSVMFSCQCLTARRCRCFLFGLNTRVKTVLAIYILQAANSAAQQSALTIGLSAQFYLSTCLLTYIDIYISK